MSSTKKSTAYESSPAALLVIGPSKDAIMEARAAIIAILTVSGCGDATKATALETLRHLCQVQSTSISGCTFSA